MQIPRVHLHRLGSDPEFLFVTPADFGFVIVPASTVLGDNKTLTQKSFIGTDARPILGELRPGPFRNIKRHLYELAYGLDAITTHLAEKRPGTQILAYPHLHDEVLGGHIHASFFVDDPWLVRWKGYGYTLDTIGGVTPIPGAKLKSVGIGIADEFQRAKNNKDIFDPQTWARAMHWLLLPFENWVQPWTAREQRNAHYGDVHSNDVVRLGKSTAPPDRPDGPSWLAESGYVHWEYRLPSTWLQHPCLAYAYLGLAKLTMLNLRHILEAMSSYIEPKQVLGNNPQFHNYKQQQPAKNEYYAELLRSRLADLYQDSPRITKDLLSLNQIIEQCAVKRRDWFYNPTPVDISAWRKLLTT